MLSWILIWILKNWVILVSKYWCYLFLKLNTLSLLSRFLWFFLCLRILDVVVILNSHSFLNIIMSVDWLLIHLDNDFPIRLNWRLRALNLVLNGRLRSSAFPAIHNTEFFHFILKIVCFVDHARDPLSIELLDRHNRRLVLVLVWRHLAWGINFCVRRLNLLKATDLKWFLCWVKNKLLLRLLQNSLVSYLSSFWVL